MTRQWPDSYDGKQLDSRGPATFLFENPMLRVVPSIFGQTQLSSAVKVLLQDVPYTLRTIVFPFLDNWDLWNITQPSAFLSIRHRREKGYWPRVRKRKTAAKVSSRRFSVCVLVLCCGSSLFSSHVPPLSIFDASSAPDAHNVQIVRHKTKLFSFSRSFCILPVSFGR